MIAALGTLFALGVFSAWSASSPDAIGVRVAPNPKHYSAARWYQTQGFKGSPQSLLVDGYEAIRDGRTVYIDVANVVENAPADNELSVGDQFFTNIFIISYNQDAEKSTKDIFGQVLANWKFNNNILKTGSCHDDPATLCVYGPSCSTGDFCVSSHDVSVRDTKRLADLASMNELLASYKAGHNGFCPTISSGSYLPNKSVSTWPSWQEELGRALGAGLPFDPINRMGACAGYNAKTCWNEQAKRFAGTSTPTSLILPAGSHAYTYYSSPDGRTCGFYAATESRLNCTAAGACTVGANISVSLDFSTPGPNRGPVVTCGNMIGLPHSPFSKFVSANDPDPGDNNNLTWAIDTAVTPVWTNWSAAPAIRNTPVRGQREIYAASSGDKGNYSFNVTVSDDRGSSTVKTCNISLGTTLPQILPISNQSVYSGEFMEGFIVYASEPEKDYPMTFTFTGDNLTTGATVNNIFTCGSVSPVFGDPSGRFNCTLNRQAVNQAGGNYQITVRATDQSGDSNTITYMLDIINNPPAIAANNFVWEASTTIPISQLLWEAVDLQSNLPIAFSNVPGLPNGIAFSTAVANRANTNVAYSYGATITNDSVGVGALQYSVNGNLADTNTFNAAATTINFTAGATDTFGANATAAYNIRINNTAPVVGPLGCAATTRHSNPYSCTFPVHDANANVISSHIAAGLPAGLSSVLAGNSITISGSPFYADVGLHNISVNATDEFDYTGANATYALDVVTYCGDNHLHNPNGEGGAEFCDINDGIAPNPAGSLPTKQYACTAACTQTGGWCGDATIQAAYTEECDGVVGIAANPATSLPTKQYACTAACAQTGGWCGNGSVQGAYGEQCDGAVGIAPNPAGSSPATQYACTPVCTQTGGWCGNGTIEAGYGEQCDGAAGIAPNPAGSTLATQYSCTAACIPTGGYCGDAVIQAGNGEVCDGGTGVAANPAVSLATKQYACTGACAFTGGYCGDGIVQGGSGESCDDNNRANGDGCDANCAAEVNWTCVGSPSVCTPDNRTVACVNASANSQWNLSPTVLQTWTGAAWFPSNNAVYDVNPGICRYVCQPCFHWDGSSCVADFCGDGACTCGENYVTCAADACVPTCPIAGTVLKFKNGGWYCEDSVNTYTWTQVLDDRVWIHFFPDGSITYTGEGHHGVLSVAYGYPFTYDQNILFPMPAGAYYDLQVMGGACNFVPAWGYSATPAEIIVPINEPAGGEHACTAVIQKNYPAQ